MREGIAFLVNFMFSPTEAFCRSTPPACSALQPLLGLPLTGSTGGYAHQTTLRLLSSSQEKISIRSRQTGSAQGAQIPRLEDLRGACDRPGGCGLGVGQPGHGTEGRGGGGGGAEFRARPVPVYPGGSIVRGPRGRQALPPPHDHDRQAQMLQPT